MQRIANSHLGGRAALDNYGDTEFRDVTFEAGYIPKRERAGDWTHIRNVSIENVAHVNCDLHTCVVDDVRVSNIKRLGSDPLFLWGCVFRHVTLEGRIAGLKINRSFKVNPPLDEQGLWDQHVKEFYQSVDWALDISGAKFAGGVSFEAIPGDKIRIDKAHQILVKRESLTNERWKEFEFGKTTIGIELGWFVRGSLFDSVVIAARTATKHAKEELAVFADLRAAGFAE